jgi:hypothetical protein
MLRISERATRAKLIDPLLTAAGWNLAAPAPNRDFIKMIVGYALTSKMRLPAVAATVEEARFQARKNGRSQVVAMDIRTALFDYQIPSDEALQQAFDPLRELPRPAVLGQAKLAVVPNLHEHGQPTDFSDVLTRNAPSVAFRGAAASNKREGDNACSV